MIPLKQLYTIPPDTWIWIEVLDTNSVNFNQPYHVASGPQMIAPYAPDIERLYCAYPGDTTLYHFDYEDYGKTWAAYELEPKKGV